jgi:cutinase-like protein
MSARRIALILGVAVAVVMTWVLFQTHHPTARRCPDVEVVSARGTDQPAGVGIIGQAFIDSLKSKVPRRNIGVYAVNYPASNDLIRSPVLGADDARAHVQATVAQCPNTRIVLSGYSQGAYVIDRITEELRPEVADHVAAVAVFGNPRSALARKLVSSQLPTISPLYRPKTIDLCTPDDPVCSEGANWSAHAQYIQSGMTTQAATFVAGKL